MRFTRTSDLHRTGISWFPTAPKTWRVVPLVACASEKHQSNAGLVESNLLSLSYGNIVRKDINSNDGLLPESFETYQVVDPGDIVLRLTDMQNDQRSLRSGIVRERGIITSAYLNLHPTSLTPDYLAYQLRAIDVCKVMYSMGGGLRQSIRYADLKQLPLLAPPAQEQLAIARFLDRETGKIDALIAEQERLIALLQEKRQAVISHAVTKGLDPHVPMKDSGVSWIGRMPAHWTAAPLRYHSRVLRGASPRPIDDPKYFSDDGEYGWVRISDVTASGMHLVVTEQRLSDVGSSLSAKLEPGALFVSIAGSVGKASIAATRVCVHDGFVYFPDLSSLMTEYLYFIFESGVCFQGLGNIGTQLNLNTGLVGSISVPQMPRDEVLAVVHFIEENVAALSSSIGDAKRLVDLLRERRTALITAAVTGQIDVRGLVETAA